MTMTLSELASDATREIHSALLEGGAKAMRNTIYLQMERAITWSRDLEHAIESGETQIANGEAEAMLHIFAEKYPDDDRPQKALTAAKAWFDHQTPPETTSEIPRRCRVGARVFEAWDTTNPNERGEYPCDGCAGENDDKLCALLGICSSRPLHHITWHEIGCVIDDKVYLRKPEVKPGSCQGCSLCQNAEACENLPQLVNCCNAIWVEETS